MVTLQLSRVLLSLLLQHLDQGDGPLVIGIDETLERRRGKRIRAKGIYRDTVRSSGSHFVKASGLRWMSLMWLTDIPWASRTWALPVLTALAPSERYYQRMGRNHKKLTDWARQMIVQLRRWLLIRDPLHQFDSQALLCTDPAIVPVQIIEWFVLRWHVEVTFQQAHAHLGVETQRQWSDRAIARTTPVLLGLFSLDNSRSSRVERSPTGNYTIGVMVCQGSADFRRCDRFGAPAPLACF